MQTHSHLQTFQTNPHLQNDALIYDGPIFQVHQLRLIQEGQSYQRDLVHKLPVVGILATDAYQRVVLVRQQRPAIGRNSLEIPAGIRDYQMQGTLEPGKKAAQRELEEECGLKSSQWKLMTECLTSPGFTDEAIGIWRAQSVQTYDYAQTASDTVEISWDFFHMNQIKDLLATGEILDIKTHLALKLWIEEEEHGAI